jgi:hypothetical protein
MDSGHLPELCRAPEKRVALRRVQHPAPSSDHLIFYFHWGLRFCRQACKDSFIAKAAEGCAHLRKRFGFEARILSRNS